MGSKRYAWRYAPRQEDRERRPAHSVLRAVVGAAILFAGQPLCGETVSDSFTGTTLNSSLWSPFFVNATGSTLQRNDRLEVAVQQPQPAGDIRAGVKLRGTVWGDFDIQVTFSVLADFLEEGGVGIACRALFGEYYITRASSGGSGARLGYNLGDREVTSEISYALTTGRLRMTRVGTRYSVYYWIPGGSAWVLLHSADSTFTGPTEVFLVVSGESPARASAAFDDFLLQADHINSEAPIQNAIALPHLATGGPWTTELIVSNAADEARQFSITFYADDGQPLPLPVTGLGTVTSVSASLPAHGTAYYEATDATGPVRGGWGSVSAGPSVAAQALFRNRAGGGVYYEAAVPSSGGVSSFVMPFDARTFAETGAPLYTGLAIANLDPSSAANVTCIARDSDGKTIPGSVSIPAVPPHGHYANYLFPNLTGTRGTLDCSSNTGIAALGLRFIGTAAFTSLSVSSK